MKCSIAWPLSAAPPAPTERDPQIIRAIQNFRMALSMRAGNLTPEQRSRIIEVIDNAAREIEKA